MQLEHDHEVETPTDENAEAQRVEDQNQYNEAVEAVNRTFEKDWPAQMSHKDKVMVRCYANRWTCCCDEEMRCYPNPTCHRPPWNFKDGKGNETCCRQCWGSFGATHGPSCDRNWTRLQNWITVLTTKNEDQREEVLEQLAAEDEEDHKVVWESLSDEARSLITTFQHVGKWYANLTKREVAIVNEYWWKAIQKTGT